MRVVDSVPGVTGRLDGHIIMRLSDASRAICLSYDGYRITAAVDGLGNPLFSNVYDAQGRVVSQDDGRAETLRRLSAMSIKAVASRTHAWWIPWFVHDDAYRLLSATNPLGHVSLKGTGNRVEIFVEIPALDRVFYRAIRQ